MLRYRPFDASTLNGSLDEFMLSNNSSELLVWCRCGMSRLVPLVKEKYNDADTESQHYAANKRCGIERM